MSSIFLFITIVQTIIAAAMVGVILMQRSEGGALGVGGSPNGLMSARGAGDLLTRMTAILATLFVVLSIVLAVMAANMHSIGDIDTSLQRGAAAPVSDPLTAPAPGQAPPAECLQTVIRFRQRARRMQLLLRQHLRSLHRHRRLLQARLPPTDPRKYVQGRHDCCLCTAFCFPHGFARLSALRVTV